jgi:hypothetical protein
MAVGLHTRSWLCVAVAAGVCLSWISPCSAAVAHADALKATEIPRMMVRATATIETSVTQGNGEDFAGHPRITAHVQAWYDGPVWMAYIQLDTDQACLVEGRGWKPKRFWTRGNKWVFQPNTFAVGDFVRLLTPWLDAHEFNHLLKNPPYEVFTVRDPVGGVNTGSVAVVLNREFSLPERGLPAKTWLFYRAVIFSNERLIETSNWENDLPSSEFTGAEDAFYVDNFCRAKTIYKDHATTAGGLPVSSESFRYQGLRALGRHCFQRIATVVTHVEPLPRNWKPESVIAALSPNLLLFRDDAAPIATQPRWYDEPTITWITRAFYAAGVVLLLIAAWKRRQRHS